jgi:hypothetical protein
MIPELGQFALILALFMALVQGTLPIVGAHLGKRAWVDVARPAAIGQFTFVLVSFVILSYAFVVQDFSVAYVAQNSNLLLPVQYRLSAVWGAHEGSLLLWILILGLWTLGVAVFSRSLPAQFIARVLGVMGLISVGFLLFILFTSNPFLRHVPALPDGNDLNPLLQDRITGGPSRQPLGPLVAALDQHQLGFPDPRNRSGELVGILRVGLGWVVVLGSRGERLVHALAGRYRIASFPSGDREAGRLQELDRAVGHRGL